MKNSIKYPAIVAIAAAGVLFTYGAVNVFAQSTTGGTVFDRVVSTLHLSVTADQLKTAFTDSQNDIMKEKVTSELQQAVTDGKLTQAQADLAAKIPAALRSLMSTETKPDFESFKDLTPELMQAKMTEMETQRNADLAKALGISIDDLTTLQTALQKAGVGGAFGPIKAEIGMGRKGGFETHVSMDSVDLTKSLADAVTAGKITQAQADLIAKVPDAMKTIMDSQTKPDMSNFKNMTREERDAQFTQMQEDIQTKLAAALGISVDDMKTLQTAAENAGIPVMIGGGRFEIRSVSTMTPPGAGDQIMMEEGNAIYGGNVNIESL